MSRNKAHTATDFVSDPAAPAEPEHAKLPANKDNEPAPEAFANIRANRDALVKAVIDRTLVDGSYQAVKWLFEFGHVNPADQSAPEDEPSLLRLLLDKLQIQETPEELAAEFTANGRALE
jgi:hypothetical protein